MQVPGTLEKERKKFEDYVELFGEHRFNREVVVQDREYTVSTDPAELQAVDRSAIYSHRIEMWRGLERSFSRLLSHRVGFIASTQCGMLGF